VLASPPVVNLLQGEAAAALADLETSGGQRTRVQAEPMFDQEHFDIAAI